MIQVLFICNPAVYPPEGSETPELYQAISQSMGARGIRLFHADPTWIQDAGSSLQVTEVAQDLNYEGFLALSNGPEGSRDLRDFDVAFCRTLKPFPEGHMQRLLQLEQHVPFVNSPAGVIEHLDPRYLSRIASGLTPPMIVTRDVDEALAFFRDHGRIVCKQSASCGGKGVLSVWHDSGRVWTNHAKEGTTEYSNAQDAFRAVFSRDEGEFQLVRFLKNIGRGDKRVLVIDGEIVGAYLRRSTGGGWVHNVAMGAGFEPTNVGNDELRIINETSHHYTRLGVRTLGYDFLVGDDGRWILSEINAGNIAGYQLAMKVGYPNALEELIERCLLNLRHNDSSKPPTSSWIHQSQ
ncbi:MAG: hypothetical protein AAF664_03300 [Planctomycetota bacterium]